METDTVAKLIAIREVKSKTTELQKTKLLIENNLRNIGDEALSLANYKAEKDLLLKERERKLEELRQINADLGTVDCLIEESSCVQSEKRELTASLYQKYSHLKSHVNDIRANVLLVPQLECLPQNLLEQLDTLATQKDSNDRPKRKRKSKQ